MGATMASLFDTPASPEVVRQVAGAESRANARDRAKRQRSIAPARTIEERFREFHERHPEVYAEYKRLALLLLKRHQEGRVKWVSSKHIFERMRADYYFAETPSDVEVFKLSNDFTSRYARLLIADDARFKNVLRLRELEAA